MSKPRIGITRNWDGVSAEPGDAVAYPYYRESVEGAGGLAVPLCFRDAIGEVSQVLDGVDGLLLSGGADINPARYGEQWHPQALRLDVRRERWELALIAEADRRGIPLLGICLGCQVMNVHRGGSLFQFLPELPGTLEHRKIGDVVLRHDVVIEADSMLAGVVGTTGLNVNTYHKQAVNRPGRGLRVVAHAPDGVIEAVEDTSGALFLGIQWHPERISSEPAHGALFSLLTSHARERAMAASRR